VDVLMVIMHEYCNVHYFSFVNSQNNAKTLLEKKKIRIWLTLELVPDKVGTVMVEEMVVCWRWCGFLFTSSFSLFSFCIISLFLLLFFFLLLLSIVEHFHFQPKTLLFP